MNPHCFNGRLHPRTISLSIRNGQSLRFLLAGRLQARSRTPPCVQYLGAELAVGQNQWAPILG